MVENEGDIFNISKKLVLIALKNSHVNNSVFSVLVQLAERMSEMEAESLAKLVELEGELVELRRQKEELENVNSQVCKKNMLNFCSFLFGG